MRGKCTLVSRLEGYIVWRGRYPVPLKAIDYEGAHEPKSKLTLKSTDPQTAKEIFRRLNAIQYHIRTKQGDRPINDTLS